MITNLSLLIIEVIFLAILVLALHRISTRYGLIPLVALALVLTVFVQVSNSSLVYIQLSNEFFLIVAASVCIPVILMIILILYIVEGTIVARLTIVSILGASLLYYLLFWSNKVHLSLAGGGSFLSLTPDSPTLSLYLRSIVASLIAFTADLFIIAIVYQGIRNIIPTLPAWIAPGIALLVSLWSDTVLYQAFCCGWPTSDFFVLVVDDLLGKTLVGVVIWPLVAIYLATLAPKINKDFRGSEHRPTFDLLFGPFRSMEVALARSEASLQESEALYQSLVEVMPMRVCRKDFEGRFTFVNKRYCDGFGLAASEILGKTDFDLHPKELAEKYRKDDLEVMTIGRTVEIVEEHQPIDGERSFVQVFKSPVYDAQGRANGLQAVFWDITERIQAEAERDKLIAELESRNAELERFTYTVSHDLKSPLITIGGFLGYLEEDAIKRDTEKLREDIQRINNATNKMKSLLDELLELSRIGRLINAPENIPFAEIVHDALERLEGQLREGSVEVEISSDLPVVYGDRARLVEVIQNLVDNAVKFMGDQPQPRIEIGVRKQNDERAFFIKDNGVGIEPQYHDKIFELFDKLNPNSEGTGIGLALVKRIVNVHEGEIWVESQGNGFGATFYFTLPMKPISKVEEGKL
jgi:PAS domain S-box-containing protein